MKVCIIGETNRLDTFRPLFTAWPNEVLQALVKASGTENTRSLRVRILQAAPMHEPRSLNNEISRASGLTGGFKYVKLNDFGLMPLGDKEMANANVGQSKPQVNGDTNGYTEYRKTTLTAAITSVLGRRGMDQNKHNSEIDTGLLEVRITTNIKAVVPAIKPIAQPRIGISSSSRVRSFKTKCGMYMDSYKLPIILTGVGNTSERARSSMISSKLQNPTKHRLEPRQPNDRMSSKGGRFHDATSDRFAEFIKRENRRLERLIVSLTLHYANAINPAWTALDNEFLSHRCSLDRCSPPLRSSYEVASHMTHSIGDIERDVLSYIAITESSECATWGLTRTNEGEKLCYWIPGIRTMVIDSVNLDKTTWWYGHKHDTLSEEQHYLDKITNRANWYQITPSLRLPLHPICIYLNRLAAIGVNADNVSMDATFGGGGHTMLHAGLIGKLPPSTLICIGNEEEVINDACAILKRRIRTCPLILVLRSQSDRLPRSLVDRRRSLLETIPEHLGVSSCQVCSSQRNFAHNSSVTQRHRDPKQKMQEHRTFAYYNSPTCRRADTIKKDTLWNEGGGIYYVQPSVSWHETRTSHTLGYSRFWSRRLHLPADELFFVRPSIISRIALPCIRSNFYLEAGAIAQKLHPDEDGTHRRFRSIHDYGVEPPGYLRSQASLSSICKGGHA